MYPGSDLLEEVGRVTIAGSRENLAVEAETALDAADEARDHRNEVVHQDWVLRGRDAIPPVSDYSGLPPDEQASYFNAWRRETVASRDWQRVPARSVDVVPAQTLDDLRQVARELEDATDLVIALMSRVASSRETGKPPGYLHRQP